MNKYIILTGTISGVGGAQLYTANKIKYLKDHGWEAQVFYYLQKKIYIDSLREFANNFIPDLQYSISSFSKRHIKRIVTMIAEPYRKYDRIIIESQILHLSFWGELIAQKVEGKHIVNCLQEQFQELTDNEAAFLEFKVKRWEILNGSQTSYKRYFGSRVKKEYDMFSNKMMPLCSNVVDPRIDIPLPQFEEGNLSILSLGRLNKPYLIPMVEEIRRFANKYNRQVFNLIFVGGSPDGKVEYIIKNYFIKQNNVRLYMLGYMLPIPQKLFCYVDVAIASSNSVLVSSQNGIPTIVIDAYDYKAIGVYGYTTNETLKRKNETTMEISDLLEEILIFKKYEKSDPKALSSDLIEETFKPQIDFVLKNNCSYCTYDVNAIYGLKERIVSTIKRIIVQIFTRQS